MMLHPISGTNSNRLMADVILLRLRARLGRCAAAAVYAFLLTRKLSFGPSDIG
jgi:hypothetical protein